MSLMSIWCLSACTGLGSCALGSTESTSSPASQWTQADLYTNLCLLMSAYKWERIYKKASTPIILRFGEYFTAFIPVSSQNESNVWKDMRRRKNGFA